MCVLLAMFFVICSGAQGKCRFPEELLPRLLGRETEAAEILAIHPTQTKNRLQPQIIAHNVTQNDSQVDLFPANAAINFQPRVIQLRHFHSKLLYHCLIAVFLKHGIMHWD